MELLLDGTMFALSIKILILIFFADNLIKKLYFVFVCRIPYIAEVTSERRKKRDVDKPFDPSVHLFSSIYCGIINSLPLGCYMENILELWKFDAEQIDNLTKEDVLNTLSTTKISPTTGHETDFVHLLGGIERNSTGHIVSAKSLLTHWMVYINFSTVDHDKNGNIAGTEDWVR